MKTLYLELTMGAAGDMLMAALWELCPDRKGFLERMNALGLEGVTVEAVPAEKCGIQGTRMAVRIHGAEEESLDAREDHGHAHGHGHHHDHAREHEHGHDQGGHTHDHGGHTHEHRSLEDIAHTIGRLRAPERVKQDACSVYRLIAGAESRAHGRPVENIHFHEVGNLDAIADIVGVCLLMHMLAPERIVASPVHVGSGQVRCAHGVLPVPAPATAHILEGVPMYGGSVRGELCTPTGAALVKHFAGAFGPMPPLRVRATGYGMGKKDFPQANCVRAFWGESVEAEEAEGRVLELLCNLDDMTPEAIGFATETLLEKGALDVYTVPIGMKKGRPGVLLACMCEASERDEMLRAIFKHTTTLGVRAYVAERYTLSRAQKAAKTPYGEVAVKWAEGYGVRRAKPEYEDVARISRERGLSLREVERLVEIQ